MKTFFRRLVFAVLFTALSGALWADPLVMGGLIDFEKNGDNDTAPGMAFSSLASLNAGWVIPAGDASVIAANPADSANMGLRFATPTANYLAVNVFEADATSPLYLNTLMYTNDLPRYTVTSFETVFAPSDVLPDRVGVLDALEAKILMCALEEDDGLPFLYVTRRIVDEYGETMTNDLMRTDIRVETNRVYKVLLESKGYQDGFWDGADPGFVLYCLSIELDGVRTCVTKDLGLYAPDSVFDFDYTAIGDWVFGYSEDSEDTRQYRQLCFFGTGFVDAIALGGEPVPEPSPEWKVVIANAEGGSVLKSGVYVNNGQIIPGTEGFSLTVNVTNSHYRVEIAGDGVSVTGDASPYSVTVPAAIGHKVLTVTFIQESTPIPSMPPAFELAGVPQAKYEAWFTLYDLETVTDDDLNAYLFGIDPATSPMPTLLITSITLNPDSTITITVAAGAPVDLGAINGELCVVISDDLTAGFGSPLRYTTVVSDLNPANATISAIPSGTMKRFVRAVITATDPGAYTPNP